MMMQSVGDARYPQRIFDTLWILVRSDWSHLGATAPLTSYPSPIFVFFAKKIVIFGRNLQRNN